jgi:hypothetical protein
VRWRLWALASDPRQNETAIAAIEARVRLGPQTALARALGKEAETFIDMTLCNGLANSAFSFTIVVNAFD